MAAAELPFREADRCPGDLHRLVHLAEFNEAVRQSGAGLG
jgi:hypothetical protein